MNILILGNLWPNEDRILALSRLGHRLVYGYSTFSPRTKVLEPEVTCLPLARRNLCGQVEHLLAQHEIDVIYCLLNQYDGSSEVALELLDAKSKVRAPIVRHYKEHPCIPHESERRNLTETDGQIYINEHSLEYFGKAYGVQTWSAHIMDADMIAERYMRDEFSPKLRIQDGEPHLLVAGTLTAHNDRHDVRQLCIEMSRRRVHVHLYGYYHGLDDEGFPIVSHEPTRRAYEGLAVAFPYIHQHAPVKPDEFTCEWSRYDAGVLHISIATHDKPLGSSPTAHQRERDAVNMRAHHKKDAVAFNEYNWSCFERMNYPFRYSAYLAAGLPLIVQEYGQDGMRSFVEHHHIGLVYKDYDDLAEQLYDHQNINLLTGVVAGKRKEFSFDRHAPCLIDILNGYARR